MICFKGALVFQFFSQLAQLSPGKNSLQPLEASSTLGLCYSSLFQPRTFPSPFILPTLDGPCESSPTDPHLPPWTALPTSHCCLLLVSALFFRVAEWSFYLVLSHLEADKGQQTLQVTYIVHTWLRCLTVTGDWVFLSPGQWVISLWGKRLWLTFFFFNKKVHLTLMEEGRKIHHINSTQLLNYLISFFLCIVCSKIHNFWKEYFKQHSQ